MKTIIGLAILGGLFYVLDAEIRNRDLLNKLFAGYPPGTFHYDTGGNNTVPGLGTIQPDGSLIVTGTLTGKVV